MLQGMAILLMLHHHFFNDLSIYGGGLAFWNETWVLRFAWFGKICVGIFAFVSGYGMRKVLEKKTCGGFYERLGRGYLICFRQAFGLLIKYWIILTGFMIILFMTGRKAFVPEEFFRNFALLEYSYNGAHWYVGQYLKMLFLLPLLDGLFQGSDEKKFRKNKEIFYGTLLAAGGVIIAVFLAIEKLRHFIPAFAEWMRVAFLLVFFVGWLMARFSVFEWVFRKMQGWNRFIWLGMGILFCAGVMAARMKLADSPAFAKLDFLFVPVLTLGILLITRTWKVIPSLFFPLGTCSAYLWLTHLFLYDLTKELVMGWTKSHLAFYVLQVLFSLLVGGACKGIEIVLRKTFQKKPQA